MTKQIKSKKKQSVDIYNEIITKNWKALQDLALEHLDQVFTKLEGNMKEGKLWACELYAEVAPGYFYDKAIKTIADQNACKKTDMNRE